MMKETNHPFPEKNMNQATNSIAPSAQVDLFIGDPFALVVADQSRFLRQHVPA